MTRNDQKQTREKAMRIWNFGGNDWGIMGETTTNVGNREIANERIEIRRSVCRSLYYQSICLSIETLQSATTTR